MAATITPESVWAHIPPRARDSHKGSFGAVLVVAGSACYRGAASLAVEGALRTGAGIVTLASVEPVLAAVSARLPECCLCPCLAGAEGGISPRSLPNITRQKATTLLLGPGLGYTAQSAARAAETRELVEKLLPGFGGSAVLDADGLNAAASLLNAGRALPHPAGELILTPHPGEMSRLTGRSASVLAADREGAACRFAREWNAVVVLKGAGTVVAAPDGRCCVNTTGNPGLSRGGSGDALAGMTAALLACGLPAYEAAACAVYLHGAAADRAAVYFLIGIIIIVPYKAALITVFSYGIISHEHLIFVWSIDIKYKNATLFETFAHAEKNCLQILRLKNVIDAVTCAYDGTHLFSRFKLSHILHQIKDSVILSLKCHIKHVKRIVNAYHIIACICKKRGKLSRTTA